MKPLVDNVVERGQRGLLRMEEACFSSTAPAEIWHTVGEFVHAALGSDPVRVEFYSVSIGAVLGLTLQDGRRIVLKVFAPWHDPQFLAAADNVRRTLLHTGYPAPQPLAELQQLGPAHAWIEEWLEAPTPASHVEVIGPLAKHLVHFVQRCRQLVPDPALARSWQTFEQPVGIWRSPPRPDADLTVEVPGTSWVREIAELGRSIADSAPGPKMIGHTDWRPDNVRFHADGSLAAVFDWDSVQLTHHVHIVAGACTSLHPPALRRFLAAYDAAAGTTLSLDERRAIAGRVIWSRASWAKFELVRQLPPVELRYVPRLEGDVDAYLEASS